MRVILTITNVLFFISISSTIFSQKVDNNVSLSQNNDSIEVFIIGTGQDSISALNSALFNAIDQVYSVFISSDNNWLHNENNFDEIISSSSGNIISYKKINQSKINDNSWISSLTVIVSSSGLKSYTTNKGYSVEFSDGLFGQKLKFQKLKLNSEITSMRNVLTEAVNLLNESSDYSLVVSDLKKTELTKEDNEYEIELNVKCLLNDNITKFNDLLIKSMIQIQMTENEVSEYEDMSKDYYSFMMYNPINQSKQIFYLRSFDSYRMLEDCFIRTNSYLSNFNIESNLGTLFSGEDFLNDYQVSYDQPDWDGNFTQCINCYNYIPKKRLWSYETHLSFPDFYIHIPNYEDGWYPFFYLYSDLMNTINENDKWILNDENLLMPFYRLKSSAMTPAEKAQMDAINKFYGNISEVQQPEIQQKQEGIDFIYLDLYSRGDDALYKLEKSNGLLYVLNLKGDEYSHKIRLVKNEEFIDKIEKIELKKIKY
jgi:hypothetical protein